MPTRGSQSRRRSRVHRVRAGQVEEDPVGSRPVVLIGVEPDVQTLSRRHRPGIGRPAVEIDRRRSQSEGSIRSGIDRRALTARNRSLGNVGRCGQAGDVGTGLPCRESGPDPLGRDLDLGPGERLVQEDQRRRKGTSRGAVRQHRHEGGGDGNHRHDRPSHQQPPPRAIRAITYHRLPLLTRSWPKDTICPPEPADRPSRNPRLQPTERYARSGGSSGSGHMGRHDASVLDSWRTDGCPLSPGERSRDRAAAFPWRSVPSLPRDRAADGSRRLRPAGHSSGG